MSVAVLRSTIRSCSFGLYPSSEAVILCFPNLTLINVFGGSWGSAPSRRMSAPGGLLRTDNFPISSGGRGLGCKTIFRGFAPSKRRSCSIAKYPSILTVSRWVPNVTFLKVCGALVGRPLSRVTAAPGGSVAIVRSPRLGPFTTEEDDFFKMKGIEQSTKVAAQTNQTHKGILFRRLMELSPPIGASASQLGATLPSLISAIFSGGLGGPAIVAPGSCSISFHFLPLSVLQVVGEFPQRFSPSLSLKSR